MHCGTGGSAGHDCGDQIADDDPYRSRALCASEGRCRGDPAKVDLWGEVENLVGDVISMRASYDDVGTHNKVHCSWNVAVTVDAHCRLLSSTLQVTPLPFASAGQFAPVLCSGVSWISPTFNGAIKQSCNPPLGSCPLEHGDTSSVCFMHAVLVVPDKATDGCGMSLFLGKLA